MPGGAASRVARRGLSSSPKSSVEIARAAAQARWKKG